MNIQARQSFTVKSPLQSKPLERSQDRYQQQPVGAVPDGVKFSGQYMDPGTTAFNALKGLSLEPIPDHDYWPIQWIKIGRHEKLQQERRDDIQALQRLQEIGTDIQTQLVPQIEKAWRELDSSVKNVTELFYDGSKGQEQVLRWINTANHTWGGNPTGMATGLERVRPVFQQIFNALQSPESPLITWKKSLDALANAQEQLKTLRKEAEEVYKGRDEVAEASKGRTVPETLTEAKQHLQSLLTYTEGRREFQATWEEENLSQKVAAAAMRQMIQEWGAGFSPAFGLGAIMAPIGGFDKRRDLVKDITRTLAELSVAWPENQKVSEYMAENRLVFDYPILITELIDYMLHKTVPRGGWLKIGNDPIKDLVIGDVLKAISPTQK